MHCVVTAGPTFEPLDLVRRLTNFSTGRLGTELANFLTDRGHRVALLIGEQSPWPGARRAAHVQKFTTTADLADRLRGLAAQRVDALFHAAAVSDFTFGKIWLQTPQGGQAEVQAAKMPSREGTLLAELVPTPKVIEELRDWFPGTRLVGWKYEVEGDRASSLQRAVQQLADCRTDACVVNGRAYGDGYGFVPLGGATAHVPDLAALFEALEQFVQTGSPRKP